MLKTCRRRNILKVSFPWKYLKKFKGENITGHLKSPKKNLYNSYYK